MLDTNTTPDCIWGEANGAPHSCCQTNEMKINKSLRLTAIISTKENVEIYTKYIFKKYISLNFLSSECGHPILGASQTQQQKLLGLVQLASKVLHNELTRSSCLYCSSPRVSTHNPKDGGQVPKTLG